MNRSVVRSLTKLNGPSSMLPSFFSRKHHDESEESDGKLKVLVLDGYTAEGRKGLTDFGVETAGVLYERMLTDSSPVPLSFTRIYPCDINNNLDFSDGKNAIRNHPQMLPLSQQKDALNNLSRFDAVAWTGCSLTVYNHQDTNVTSQLDLARELFRLGIPQFGSCWGLQIAVTAAGGRCAPSPKGREMGIGRKVELTNEGRSHGMYRGKYSVFDAYMSHDDEVTHMPHNSLVLAKNKWSSVQAGSVRMYRGEFWAVQYHPEYDLADLAHLIGARLPKLCKLNIFKDEAAGKVYVSELLELAKDRTRKDLAWKLGFDEGDFNDTMRNTECYNWITQQVIPYHLHKYWNKQR